MDSNKNVDLGRMYSLVSRISEGLKELKAVLEEHIHKQGVEVIAQCGDAAINVSVNEQQLTEFTNHSQRKLNASVTQCVQANGFVFFYVL